MEITRTGFLTLLPFDVGVTRSSLFVMSFFGLFFTDVTAFDLTRVLDCFDKEPGVLIGNFDVLSVPIERELCDGDGETLVFGEAVKFDRRVGSFEGRLQDILV